MSFFPHSKSSDTLSFRGILLVPGLLISMTLLLGFRFYEKHPHASSELLSGEEGFLQAAAEPEKLATPQNSPQGNAAQDSGKTAQPAEKQATAEAEGVKSAPAPTEGGATPTPGNPLTAGAGSILKTEATPAAEGQEQAQDLDILNLTPEEVKILQSLASRRSDIEKREKSILEREHLLEVAEQRIDQKVQELQKIRDMLKNMVAARQKHETERMQGLVKIYELMKPDKAAPIFEGLDLDVLLEVVDMMKETKLSPILSAMNPRAAQRLTAELAARRKFTQDINKISQQEEPASDGVPTPPSAQIQAEAPKITQVP